ncbi:MAG: TatD family hydrolase [Clostridia bacterium]|nr:TatD family hydrolase [Clostridia bacterium]MDH7573356.1 TatD family hydrolase [Clostridia bacterium]
MLVDSHAHLDDPRFGAELPEVIERARAAGVTWIITVGTDLASSREAVNLAHRYPMVAAAVGFHPHEARHFREQDLEALAELARDPRVVAIGEIGLDYYYNRSPREVQLRVFDLQLRLAQTLGLPVIVHNREAHRDTETLLERVGPGLAGVIHCFSGDAAMAGRLVKRGFYLSFAGPVTFPRTEEHYRRVLAAVPPGRFLVETDSPYLSPVPYRGQRNEPARVKLVAERLAELLETDTEEVIGVTGGATANLFHLSRLEQEESAGQKAK